MAFWTLIGSFRLKIIILSGFLLFLAENGRFSPLFAVFRRFSLKK